MGAGLLSGVVSEQRGDGSPALPRAAFVRLFDVTEELQKAIHAHTDTHTHIRTHSCAQDMNASKHTETHADIKADDFSPARSSVFK